MVFSRSKSGLSANPGNPYIWDLKHRIMETGNRVSRIIDKMYDHDPFSLWLGIERVEERLGYCKLKMVVRNEMLNGFGIAHGGISFSLADSALAFASNSHGRQAVSIECSVNHIRPVGEGEVIMAEAVEKSRTSRLGIYEIKVTNQSGALVALFNGMVFIKEQEWSV